MNFFTEVRNREELKILATSTSGEVPPDGMAIHLAAHHRAEVEAHLNRRFSKFQPVAMKGQVGNGVNYEIRVDCNNGEFIIMKVFVPAHGHGGSCLTGVKNTLTK